MVLAAAAGLILRLAWGAYVGGHEPQGLYDPSRYLGYARVISDGHGMIEPMSGQPTAYYPPGYPWFLGLVGWLSAPFTDDIQRVAIVAQVVLGSLSVFLGAHLAHRLAGPRAALVAAWGLAFYPNLIFHSGVLLGETLYNALFLAFLLAAVRLGDHEAPRWAAVVATGFVLGLAVMVRPIALVMVPVLFGVWWWRSGDRAQTVRFTGLILVGVLACMLPWSVRNSLRLDHTVILSTNTGDNLCIGHAEGANGSFTFNEPCLTDHSILEGPDDEVAADKEKTSIAIEAIRNDPGRQPWLLWRRFWFTWIRDGDHDGLVAAQSYMSDSFVPPETHRRLAYGADLAYWAVGVLGVAGLVLVLRRRGSVELLVAGALAVNALVPLAFFGDSRFKVPAMPLLVILGAVTVAAAWERALPRLVDGAEPSRDPVGPTSSVVG